MFSFVPTKHQSNYVRTIYFKKYIKMYKMYLKIVYERVTYFKCSHHFSILKYEHLHDVFNILRQFTDQWHKPITRTSTLVPLVCKSHVTYHIKRKTSTSRRKMLLHNNPFYDNRCFSTTEAFPLQPSSWWRTLLHYSPVLDNRRYSKIVKAA